MTVSLSAVISVGTVAESFGGPPVDLIDVALAMHRPHRDLAEVYD